MLLRRGIRIHLLITCAVLVALGAAWGGRAGAQEKYPTRPIEIICPFSAGGSTDLSARLVAEYAKRKWKIPANVTNKTGGNTMPALMDLYSAKPDGYTLFGESQNSSSMLPVVVKQLPFKIMDRSFLGIWNTTPTIFFVAANSPIKSLKDLEAEIKKDPDNFTWTSLGGVGAQDYATRQLVKAIGVDVLRTKAVMAPGGAQATALAGGGHVKLGSGTITSTIAGIEAGLVRVIAITGKTRFSGLPDVPTFEEQGYPTVTGAQWNGLSAPPKTADHLLQLWDGLLVEMSKDADVQARMKKVGLMPVHYNAKETREFIAKQSEEIEVLWGLK